MSFHLAHLKTSQQRSLSNPILKLNGKVTPLTFSRNNIPNIPNSVSAIQLSADSNGTDLLYEDNSSADFSFLTSEKFKQLNVVVVVCDGSKRIGEKICGQVPFVVCVDRDASEMDFLEVFYELLSSGKEVDKAFELGKISISSSWDKFNLLKGMTIKGINTDSNSPKPNPVLVNDSPKSPPNDPPKPVPKPEPDFDPESYMFSRTDIIDSNIVLALDTVPNLAAKIGSNSAQVMVRWKIPKHALDGAYGALNQGFALLNYVSDHNHKKISDLINLLSNAAMGSGNELRALERRLRD